MKKKLAILLTFVLLMGMTLQAEAAGSLSGSQIMLSYTDTEVTVSTITTSTKVADRIGVKDVVLEEYRDGGWHKVMSSDGGSRENAATFSGSATYTKRDKNRTYRASCVHYAIFSDGTTVEAKGSV